MCQGKKKKDNGSREKLKISKNLRVNSSCYSLYLLGFTIKKDIQR